jgi:mevalonate pyrophosphate decarboxylase
METIIALLMFVGVDQKLVEMTWTPSISKCLEKKRIATRNREDNKSNISLVLESTDSKKMEKEKINGVCTYYDYVCLY